MKAGRGCRFQSPRPDEDKLSATIGKASSGAVPNTDEIAPFATATSYQKARMVALFLEPLGDPSIHGPIPDDPSAGKALIRPKTFGPERVVEDPRVKAALLRFIWEMHLFAFCGSIVSLIKQSQDHSDIFISKVFSLSYSQFHAVIIPSSHLTVVVYRCFRTSRLRKFMGMEENAH